MRCKRERTSRGLHLQLLLVDSRKERGFTLLEVLIAFAITCIILAALYSTFFLSRRAVDAVDESLLRMQEARSVMDVMRRELESAVYISGKDYSVFKLDDRDFYGKQASQLRFASLSPSVPGISKIDYTVEEGEGGLVLRKTITSAYAASEEAKPFELMENIDSFKVEVKFNDKWVKTWDSKATNSLPDEIRISVNVTPEKGDVPITISDIAKRRMEKPL